MWQSDKKFGSDVMDLYRFICVTLEQNGNPRLKDYFSEKFLPLIDDLQFFPCHLIGKLYLRP